MAKTVAHENQYAVNKYKKNDGLGRKPLKVDGKLLLLIRPWKDRFMSKSCTLKIIIPLLASCTLTACVGVDTMKTVRSDALPIEMTTYSKYTGESTATPPWANIAHSENDAVQFNSHRSWCGVTLWAVVVPVPLLLPVCKTYTEVGFENNIPKTIQYVNTKETTYACGPGIYVVTGGGPRVIHESHFCGVVHYNDI